MSILAIKQEQNYFSLKENIKAKSDQLIDIERDILIERDKRIEQNEVLNLRLKTDV